MAQEFHVVRCCSCGKCQVHIVRKDGKFSCKMCGQKQSVRKVYGKGSAKDCRLHVQKLNTFIAEKQQEKEHQLEQQIFSQDDFPAGDNDDDDGNYDSECYSGDAAFNSRYANDGQDFDDGNGDDDGYFVDNHCDNAVKNTNADDGFNSGYSNGVQDSDGAQLFCNVFSNHVQNFSHVSGSGNGNHPDHHKQLLGDDQQCDFENKITRGFSNSGNSCFQDNIVGTLSGRGANGAQRNYHSFGVKDQRSNECISEQDEHRKYFSSHERDGKFVTPKTSNGSGAFSDGSADWDFGFSPRTAFVKGVGWRKRNHWDPPTGSATGVSAGTSASYDAIVKDNRSSNFIRWKIDGGGEGAGSGHTEDGPASDVFKYGDIGGVTPEHSGKDPHKGKMQSTLLESRTSGGLMEQSKDPLVSRTGSWDLNDVGPQRRHQETTEPLLQQLVTRTLNLEKFTPTGDCSANSLKRGPFFVSPKLGNKRTLDSVPNATKTPRISHAFTDVKSESLQSVHLKKCVNETKVFERSSKNSKLRNVFAKYADSDDLDDITF